MLHLVHRPTVRSVLQGLLRKRLLPMEHGVSKAKRIIGSCNSAAAKEENGPGGNLTDQSSMKASVKTMQPKIKRFDST